MIQCDKCGKRYDYEKYNGICPKCGRYNRRDSAVLERELHSRYDEDPAHTAESHDQVHEKNYDSYRHQTEDRRKPDGNFWGSEENYTKRHLAVVLVVIIVIVMFFVFSTTAGFFGYSDEVGEGILDNAEEMFVWENDTETESSNSIVQRIQDSLNGLADMEDEYDWEMEDDFVEEVYLSYSYMEPVEQELTDVDWEDDHSVRLLEGDLEDIEELEAEYSGQEGEFYLITVHVYNDTSEDLDASSIIVEDISFSDEEGNAWELPCLKTFYSYWEMIEAGHNGYQDWLVFMPDDMLYAAQEEGYLTFSLSYVTEQDGEAIVNTCGDNLFYCD